MNTIKVILNLIKSDGKFFTLFLFALSIFINLQVVSAQIPPVTPKAETKPKIVITPQPQPTPPKNTKAKQVIVNESETPAEKSIMVESKVYVSLCVTEGRIRINGWDRDEVRAFVKDGSQVGFKIGEKNPKNKKPVLIYVLGYDPQKKNEIQPEDCLSGSEIELDVPRGAIINLKSDASETTIDSVRKVSVKNVGGDIFLQNIAEGIEAATYEGGVTVENSSGAMTLESGSGNIIAIEVSPSEIGDIFKAKTNSGIITLNSVKHRQIETSSISSSTSFVGELIDGGQYSFRTESGLIGLAIPAESACKINGWFGFGRALASEIPLKEELVKAQNYSALMGDTETNCTLNLKTSSGSVRIRKRQ